MSYPLFSRRVARVVGACCVVGFALSWLLAVTSDPVRTGTPTPATHALGHDMTSREACETRGVREHRDHHDGQDRQDRQDEPGSSIALGTAPVGRPGAWDARLLMTLRAPDDPTNPVGPRWFESVVRDVTSLGGSAVVGILAAAAVLLLLTSGRLAQALAVALSWGGVVGLANGLKMLTMRPRPPSWLHLTDVSTASFPSSHAALATAFYCTVAWVGCSLLVVDEGSRRNGARLLLAWAVAVALLVGASRLYLGVHWPSDVTAGWALGGLWAMACCAVCRRLERSG